MTDLLDELDDILSSPSSRPRTSYLAAGEARVGSGRPPPVPAGWGDAPPASPAPAAPAPAPLARRHRTQFDELGIDTAASAPSGPDPRVSTWDDDTTVVPMIPDLEEVQEEELTQQVASAPMAPVNRVATMQELNDDLFKHPTFMALEDIDLRLLTRRLSEPADVHEVDKPWIWDVLFTEVLSEIQDESGVDDIPGELPTPRASASVSSGRRAASGRLQSDAGGQVKYSIM